MRVCSFLAALVILAAPGLASDLTHGWKIAGEAAPDDRIDLHIALKPSRSWSEIERIALDIASPSHDSFRKHLSHDQASALADSGTDAEEAVRSWMIQCSIVGTVRGGILEASTKIKHAQDLLNATYHYYVDPQSGERIARIPGPYRVPDFVQPHIEFITPTSQWPLLRLNRVKSHQRLQQQTLLDQRAWSGRDSRAAVASRRDRDRCGASDFVSPDCIKKIYNITYTPAPNRTTFAVYGTEAASFSASGLQDFLEDFRPPAASASPTYQVVGSGDPNEGSGGIGESFETALDTQTLMGLAWPAKGILYNNGGVFGPPSTRGKTYDRMVTFLQDLIQNNTVPSVVSFSESMPEDSIDPDYAKRLCRMMAQIGARGVTLVFSSGDNGPNGDTSTGSHSKVFETEFPASCPWITAIGGTTNMTGEVGATKKSMKGAGIGNAGYTSSGGGFSALFDRPAYQDSFVDSYIHHHVPSSYVNESGYSAMGRGVPDVSAFSSNVPVKVIGITFGIGGTSGSTPIWAAVMAILNDYQAGRGKSPLGFVNPWLYSLRDGALKDITEGGDNVGGCGIGCYLDHTLGYNVTEGWDPVTGLGSPNVGLMIQALLAEEHR